MAVEITHDNRTGAGSDGIVHGLIEEPVGFIEQDRDVIRRSVGDGEIGRGLERRWLENQK
jgi:hypothetical protein